MERREDEDEKRRRQSKEDDEEVAMRRRREEEDPEEEERKGEELKTPDHHWEHIMAYDCEHDMHACGRVCVSASWVSPSLP